MRGLKDKVAVATGGGQGIGRALTPRLAEEGCKVAIFDLKLDAARETERLAPERAREMWFLNKPYSAQQAHAMGLVNKVVPFAELDAAAKAWTDILAERSPTALALAKRSFNTDSKSNRGISPAMRSAGKLFYESEESKEGVCAFKERRKPDFHTRTK